MQLTLGILLLITRGVVGYQIEHAITHVARTANVVVEEDAVLVRLGANTLKKMLENQELNRLFLSKMTERMARMGMIDLPKFRGVEAGISSRS